ncbi:LysR family transcriptional regulator [Clostridium grantii]|uniref:DNA-binding transcriptional regulator, LysR family n=1 Tax=Clostridium grantii DSM 8605 TaxID=1121316 RepID=A0A1M5W1U5_9CLOT|nr:LysR family transcriptional regulator [Clostridium grantii]SHH81482.1 DNA-binding transcriptional regulator, LysR family [Clostridium grantii DSM 8605]
MEIKEFKYFAAVCKHKNISKTAKSLYISQQALSTSIKNLEQKLNTTLFRRTPTGVELTNEGIYLAEKIDSFLEQYDSICTDIYSHFDISKGTISIGITLGILRSLSPMIFIDFMEAYPDIKIDKLDYLDELCKVMVMNETIHTAISIKPVNSTNIDFISIKSEPLMLLVNKQSDFSQLKTVKLKDLANVPLITCDERLQLYHYQIQKFKQHNISPNFIFKTNEIEVMTSLVSQNKGMLICAEHVCLGNRHNNVIGIPFEDKGFVWEYGFLLKKGKPISKNIKKLIDFIINKV